MATAPEPPVVDQTLRDRLVAAALAVTPAVPYRETIADYSDGEPVLIIERQVAEVVRLLSREAWNDDEYGTSGWLDAVTDALTAPTPKLVSAPKLTPEPANAEPRDEVGRLRARLAAGIPIDEWPTTGTAELVEFLTAQLDRDEQWAIACGPPLLDWYLAGDGALAMRTSLDHGYDIVQPHVVRAQIGTLRVRHIAHHDPARVLRDVAAKRRHIERWRHVDGLIAGSTGMSRNELLSVRRAHALVIADDAAAYLEEANHG